MIKCDVNKMAYSNKETHKSIRAIILLWVVIEN